MTGTLAANRSAEPTKTGTAPPEQTTKAPWLLDSPGKDRRNGHRSIFFVFTSKSFHSTPDSLERVGTGGTRPPGVFRFYLRKEAKHRRNGNPYKSGFILAFL